MEHKTENVAEILLEIINIKINHMPYEPLQRFVNLAELVKSQNQDELNEFISSWNKHKTHGVVIDWEMVSNILVALAPKKLAFIMEMLNLIANTNISNFILIRYALKNIIREEPGIADDALRLQLKDLLIIIKYKQDEITPSRNFSRKLERGKPVSSKDLDSTESDTSSSDEETIQKKYKEDIKLVIEYHRDYPQKKLYLSHAIKIMNDNHLAIAGIERTAITTCPDPKKMAQLIVLLHNHTNLLKPGVYVTKSEYTTFGLFGFFDIFVQNPVIVQHQRSFKKIEDNLKDLLSIKEQGDNNLSLVMNVILQLNDDSLRTLLNDINSQENFNTILTHYEKLSNHIELLNSTPNEKKQDMFDRICSTRTLFSGP